MNKATKLLMSAFVLALGLMPRTKWSAMLRVQFRRKRFLRGAKT